MVSVEEVTHKYGERTALAGLSFEVGQGEVFGLLGPNGGGKSTLFRILSTMLRPGSGRARIGGFDVVEAPDQVRSRIGVVFQSHSLDRKLTVEENLVAQGNLFGLWGGSLRGRVREVAGRLGLSGRMADLAGTLSGGLQRRLEIAKALLHRPAVLLMDEPSTGLDPGARRDLWDYVAGLRADHGVTILLTTHILEEADRCDRLLLLHQGRKVAEGTPAELKSKVGGDVVVLDAADPDGLARGIAERFKVSPHVAGETLRVEIANGHRFIAEVVEAFPGLVRSVGLHKPTLEDVFVDETGVGID